MIQEVILFCFSAVLHLAFLPLTNAHPRKIAVRFFLPKIDPTICKYCDTEKKKEQLSLPLSLILVIILFQQWDNARECEIKSFAKYYYDQSLSPKKYSSWRYKNLDNISLYAQTLLTLYSTHILSSVSQRSQTIYGSEKNFIWSIGIENDKKNYKFGRGRFMNFFTCDHG